VPAIVRDIRHLSLGAGRTAWTLRALPVDFDAHGVSLQTATGQFDVIDLRASGTNDTYALLLSAHVGKHVRVPKERERSTWVDGILLAVASSSLARVVVDGDVRNINTAEVLLADPPPPPTLDATVQGAKADVDAELVYSTSQLRSSVSYRLLRDAGTTHGWLGGYATIENHSGVDLPNAAFTITADAASLRDFSQGGSPTRAAAASDTTTIRFASPVSVPAGHAVSTRLFAPRDVTLTRRVVIEGQGLPVYSATAIGEARSASVRAVVDAVAVGGGKLSPLGMLPGGTDLFEGDAQGSDPPRWFGETIARPLPGGVGLRVDIGVEGREVDTQRRLLATRNLGRCVTESSWEVSVTNPTEEAIPFEDVEPVTGDYTVVESNLPVTAKGRDYFGFGFPVEGKATVRLRFRARVTSCVDAVDRRGYWYGGKMGPSAKMGSSSF
jgi:hypothetical protein